MEQHFFVAAVGSANQQDHVGTSGAERRDVTAGQQPGGDVDDFGPGGEGDAVPGFGADQPFLADDGQP